MGRWLSQAAILALGVALALPAAAITVSDVRAVSAAGEPLNVEIELSDLLGTPEKDISVTAASAADHARLGMTRPVWLDQLHFVVVRTEQGQVLARGTAAQTMPDTPVSFLVQIGWPGHVRLQQVSASLRQPGTPADSVTSIEPLVLPAPTVIPASGPQAPSSDSTIIAAAPADTATAADTTVIPADAVATASAAAAAPAPAMVVSADPATAPAAGDSLEVRPGDTLSSLAEAWDASDLNLAQRQQLIRQSNPKAFIGGDINRLRVGARLTLPRADAAPASTPSQAAAWLRQAEQGEAAKLSRPTEVADAPGQSAVAGPGDKEVTLTLVAPGKGAQGRAAGEAGAAESDGEALKTRESLAAAEQTRARLLGERKALSEKLQSLTSHTAEQDARLKVLNERLAAFDQNAQGIQAAKPDAAAESKFSLSGETWVWIIFGGMLLAFLLIRLRHDDEPVKPAEATGPEPTYAAFTGEEFTPLPPDPALAWPEEEPAAEEEYDFLTDSEAEAHQTRLDLAQAYIEMKEVQPARDLLAMVQQGGTSEQRQRASELLQSLG